MNTQQKIIPQTKAPELKVQLVGGEIWDLKEQNPEKFTMIIFYRGLHCPVCEKNKIIIASRSPSCIYYLNAR